MSRRRYLQGLFLTYGLFWAVLAVAPHHRADWLLENVLVVLVLPLLWRWNRRRPFSRAAWTMIFLFAMLHALGAHYTYAEVPYEDWLRALTGTTLREQFGIERNHFDRLVHFLFGLLFFRPLRELLDDRLTLPPAWRIALPVLILAFISMLYEFVEWAAAEYFGGGLGMAYLGTQGDVWDAHKDMALALLGSLLAPFMDRRALRLSPTSPQTPRTSHAG